MTEGYEKKEVGLGRGPEREKDLSDLVDLETVQEAREAFLSDSKYAGKMFTSFVAHTLIADNALNVVARNLHRFPQSDHAEIIDSLSETKEGRAALGIE